MRLETGNYWIPAHIRACHVAPDTVLLDLERNRYFAVGERETRALSTFAANWQGPRPLPNQTVPLEETIAAADALVEAGILSRTKPVASFEAGVIDLDGALSSAGHEMERRTRIEIKHVYRFVAALLWATHAVRSRTLYSVAQEIGTRKRGAIAFDTGRAIELTCIFRRLQPFTFLARDRCLFHALVLIDFLGRYRIYPTWVIGVRTRPWAAHSWVQHSSLLLDSTPEHVCEYTPILTA